MIRAVIFDWGGTLWSNEDQALMPGAEVLLEYCKNKGYGLALLSRGDDVYFEVKREFIQKSGVEYYFAKVVLSTKKEKEEIDEIRKTLGDILYKDIIMIGDRVQVDVKVANQLGMQSIWVRQGKFAEELPDKETREPCHIVSTLQEIRDIL